MLNPRPRRRPLEDLLNLVEHSFTTLCHANLNQRSLRLHSNSNLKVQMAEIQLLHTWKRQIFSKTWRRTKQKCADDLFTGNKQMHNLSFLSLIQEDSTHLFSGKIGAISNFSLRYVISLFPFKRDFSLYLNSARANA